MDYKAAGHQLCILNGVLTLDIYMHQPKGFIDPRFPSHVYKLNKALYGLEQALKIWYDFTGAVRFPNLQVCYFSLYSTYCN